MFNKLYYSTSKQSWRDAMKKLGLLLCLFVFSAFGNVAQQQVTKTPHHHTTKQKLDGLSSEQILKLLLDGNQRFLYGVKLDRNHLKMQNYAQLFGQHPHSIFLACIDSRSIPELVFDLGVGDAFTARVAGNVINNDMLASMEYATKVVGTKVIIIMGHTDCGAVKAACEKVKLGHITDLVKQITPAVEAAAKIDHTQNCNDPKFVDEIAKQNVLIQIQRVLKQSSIIKLLVDEHKVIIIGAMLNIQTGKVIFFDKKT